MFTLVSRTSITDTPSSYLSTIFVPLQPLLNLLSCIYLTIQVLLILSTYFGYIRVLLPLTGYRVPLDDYVISVRLLQEVGHLYSGRTRPDDDVIAVGGGHLGGNDGQRHQNNDALKSAIHC